MKISFFLPSLSKRRESNLVGTLCLAKVNPQHICIFWMFSGRSHLHCLLTFELLFWICIVSCCELSNLCYSCCLMSLKNALKECDLNIFSFLCVQPTLLLLLSWFSLAPIQSKMWQMNHKAHLVHRVFERQKEAYASVCGWQQSCNCMRGTGVCCAWDVSWHVDNVFQHSLYWLKYIHKYILMKFNI